MQNINSILSSCSISSHQCRCFEKLSEAEAALIDKNSVKIRFSKGEIISKQGSFVSQIMYMEKGLAKVYIDNGKNTLVLKIIKEGNFIGLTTLSEDSTFLQYSASAYIDSDVRLIDISVFRQVLSSNIEFAKEVIEILGTNSAQMYGRFFCLTHKQSYGRLADILLCLSERIFKKEEFELPLSRKDLAELSGMSSETVIRMLKRFHAEGLIYMKGKEMKIVDFEKLRRISETG